MKSKFLLAALAAATLAACGGGGSDGGGGGFAGLPPYTPPPRETPPEQTPPGDTTSSAPCFNEADLHQGTVVEAEQDVTTPLDPNKTTKVRVTYTTREREAFAGANPVRIIRSAYDYVTGSTVEVRVYKDVVGGSLLQYGVANGGEGADPKYGYAVNEPPIGIPVAMTPGQTVNVSYVTKSVSGENGELKTEQAASLSHTYKGRETLDTPMGSFKVCKTVGVQRFKLPDDKEALINIEDWVAAEGPYRGQSLKFTVRNVDGVLMGGSFVVTKLTYTPK